MSLKLAEVIQQAEILSTDEQLRLIAHLAQKLSQSSEASQASISVQNSQPTSTSKAPQPIWEIFESYSKNIPEDVLALLPTDGAEQHDHYLYGSPKRPT